MLGEMLDPARMPLWIKHCPRLSLCQAAMSGSFVALRPVGAVAIWRRLSQTQGHGTFVIFVLVLVAALGTRWAFVVKARQVRRSEAKRRWQRALAFARAVAKQNMRQGSRLVPLHAGPALQYGSFQYGAGRNDEPRRRADLGRHSGRSEDQLAHSTRRPYAG